MRAYPLKLRNRVLEALERGDSPTQIARSLNVSRVWVYNVKNRFRDTGERSTLQVGGYRRSRLAEFESRLRAWVEAEPTLTLAQIQELLEKLGFSVKTGALWHQLKKWKLTLSTNTRRRRARFRRVNSKRR